MDAVIIRKVPLPKSVHGITILDDDGDFNIYLNSDVSPDKQAAAFRREVARIRREKGLVPDEPENIHL